MKIFNGLDTYLSDELLSIAIGNFDGLHIGHRSLIDILKARALELNIKTAILTFAPHPLKLFNIPLQLIDSSKKRLEIFQALDIDYLININFDEAISKLTAEDFFYDILIKKLHVKLIVVGSNYHFGAKKHGDIKLISYLAKRNNIETIFVENIKDENNISISSSRIRDLILDGDMLVANRFLGRAFSIYGKVIKGDGYGKSFGFPTINLAVDAELIPKVGVYATKILIDNKRYNAMSYIGYRPTINDKKELRIEANIFDFDRDIYGDIIELEFYKYIRSDEKFTDLDLLKTQLSKDKSSVIDFFKVAKI